ncbi:glycosyl hydrolase 53 family protein [Ekhidna sp.]
METKVLLILSLLLLSGCSSDDSSPNLDAEREFGMGFTTWSYGPNIEDVTNTYSFISDNADIYAEHIDNSIPWNEWINDQTLPSDFTNEITGRAAKKISGKQLLLSVSLLNSNRDELASNLDGTIPSYTNLDDDDLKGAYFKHVNYLVGEFDPDYLVIAIEVNELRLRSSEKWNGYKNLIADVKSRIRLAYPDLKIAESVSLHNLYEPEISDPSAYIDEIMDHVNQNDFIAISYYPFLKNQSSKSEMQETLDFLHDKSNKPIAFVETAHIAENLVIPNLNVSIDGSEIGQNLYLETLLENAAHEEYEFIIWWAHRDYDALWETFPEEVKDLGQIWRDTGLLNEDGVERPAFTLWSDTFRD